MHIYQLSPLSIPIFQRCIELASQNSVQNQWNLRFSRDTLLPGYNHLINNIETVVEDEAQPTENQEILEQVTDISTPSRIDEEKYKEIIESNPITHIKFISEESIKDEAILLTLARNLSDSQVEKLCQYVFENSLDIKFVELFLTHFLITYFKRQNTWLSIDILVKVHKHYPQEFKKVVQKIILDTEISSNILQEFISTLNENDYSNVFQCLIEVDISADIFIKNIFMIYTMYKASIKDERIQNFTFSKLEEASEKCVTDKQYGRFLLTYLQNKNDNTKLINLQKIVEEHRSPFRRPCLNLMNEIMEKFNK